MSSAYVAHLYGLSRSDFDHILGTFPLVFPDTEAAAQQYMNATVNAGGSFYTPTVLPGWNESAVAGRENPTSPQDRAGGAFLTNSWNGAASSGAGAILIVSWNEYLENSHIEPSQNFGTLALDGC